MHNSFDEKKKSKKHSVQKFTHKIKTTDGEKFLSIRLVVLEVIQDGEGNLSKYRYIYKLTKHSLSIYTYRIIYIHIYIHNLMTGA